MAVDLEKARELFVEAVGRLPPERWDEFLAERCGADAELRSHVTQLLRAHVEAGSFLQQPAVARVGPFPGRGAIGVAGPAVTIEQREIIETDGSVIGPYKILGQIGEGGFGIVFIAEQTLPVRRKVALKILKPGMDTRQVVARFEAERQALAIMDHPNIAKVLDGGTTASGRPYFVMDLVNGVPITEYCDKNQLAPRERLELFVSVCLAVQHAHQKGIIHRDLKPSNVMVTVYEGTPTVKVIDFGVAKALSQELTDKTLITGLAQMIGTPLYMSPEQAGQGALDIDTRSDIYSLGVLLYELLTGTTPIDKVRFKQAAYDEIRRIIREEEPPKPSTRLIELGRSSLRSGPNSAADPVGRSEHTSLDSLSAVRDTEPVKLTRLMRGELDWIVMKALEKDRNRRYETANALAMDIDRFLHEQPVLACPPSATYQLRKFARRNRAALAMTTLVGVVFLFGSIISIWQAVRATQAEGLAMRRLDEVDLARKTAVGERIRAEQRLFDARLAEARASRLSRQVGHRSQIWRALAETARLARELKLGSDRLMELRNEAIACLAITDVLPVHEWEGFPSGSSGIAFDANIEHYARSGLKGDISVRRVSDDQELTLLAGEKLGDLSLGATALVFSPDGSYLAVRNLHPSPGQSSELRIWDWRLGQCIMQPSFNVSSAAFSPNSRLVALGQEKGILSIHEVPGGKEEKRIDSGVNAYAMAFDPDGSRLAVASYAGHEIQVRETATGDLLEKWTTPSGILHIAWKSDGLLLATAGFDRNAYVWNPATGLQHVLLQGHQDVIGSVVFSPSHDIVVTQSFDGTSRFWEASTGHELLRFAGRISPFSRDGTRLVCRTGAKLTFLEVAPSSICRTLARSPGEVVRPGGFSPDGRWFAVATGTGVRFWDTVRGKSIGFLPGSTTVDVKFHPRDEELFTVGRNGLFRWPLHTQPELLHIGPARRLNVPGRMERLSVDREGRVVCGVEGGTNGGGRVLNLEDPTDRVIFVPHENAASVATSPNGKWVATGTQNGFGVKIWDTQSGELLRILIDNERTTQVVASPDSRWLVTGTSAAFDIWEAGSWELVRRIGRESSGEAVGNAAFSPDGSVLAIAYSGSVVQLIDVATGGPLARLQPPNPDIITWMAFSPDGSQLAISTATNVIRLWDLRLIRSQLTTIGLNWDLPPYPPPSDEPSRVQLHVELGDFPHFAPGHQNLINAMHHWRNSQWGQAIAEVSKGLELLDFAYQAEALNNLAWYLVACPDPQYRNVARALQLAQSATELAPHVASYWNTLGVAHYYSKEWTEAIAALEQSDQLEPGRFGQNGFFLAMSHWRLGTAEVKNAIEEQTVNHQAIHREKARLCFDQAVRWVETNKPKNKREFDELNLFRAEAAKLLGLHEQKD